MKKFWKGNKHFPMHCRLAIVMLVLFALSCQGKKQLPLEIYTCPMHLTVSSDKPGACPICDMKLVKIKKSSGQRAAIDLTYQLKPANAAVISSIKTIAPERKSVEMAIRVNGMINYDEQMVAVISARVGGRVDRLYVKYDFQPVHKGEKILEIYSPELVTAQRDLLYLIRSDKGNEQLVEGAKEKLRLAGISDPEINKLISTGTVSKSFPLFSPVEGYVIKSKMSEPKLREGIYVNAGQSLLNVVDPRSVWAEFDLYGLDGSGITKNDTAKISFDGIGDEVEAIVSLIQPFYKEGQQFSKVRIKLKNGDGRYRIGQLAQASFRKLHDATWIPLTARIVEGTRQLVFLRRNGLFEPKEIVTGQTADGWVEVKDGVSARDSIAYDAEFLIDSESFIKYKRLTRE